MKKNWLLLLFISVLFSCSDNSINNKNPNIPNYRVDIEINTSFPLYNGLLHLSNPVLIPNQGAQGIIVMKVGDGMYNAFDAACPNQSAMSCKAMTLDGINAVCSCDKSEYNLYSGLGYAKEEYPMKQYRVTVNGNLIHVYN